jgi:hypothetical protein
LDDGVKEGPSDCIKSTAAVVVVVVSFGFFARARFFSAEVRLLTSLNSDVVTIGTAGNMDESSFKRAVSDDDGMILLLLLLGRISMLLLLPGGGSGFSGLLLDTLSADEEGSCVTTCWPFVESSSFVLVVVVVVVAVSDSGGCEIVDESSSFVVLVGGAGLSHSRMANFSRNVIMNVFRFCSPSLPSVVVVVVV